MPDDAEIGRVLRPGGTFSQQVGTGSNRELTDFMMGPQPVSQARSASQARVQAEAAGLVVTDLREQALRTVFSDVGAVAYFLRKVLWTAPAFPDRGPQARGSRKRRSLRRSPGPAFVGSC